MTGRGRTWAVGGVLLLASTLVAAPMGPTWVGFVVIAQVLRAAGIILLALGFSPRESIVGRRPLGVIALFVFALSPVIVWLPVGATYTSTDSMVPAPGDLAIGYVGIFIPVAAALIAVVQIGRVGIVPRPWRWAPLMAFAAHTAAALALQIAIVAVPTAPQEYLLGWMAFAEFVDRVVWVGLGALAVFLGGRDRAEIVQIDVGRVTSS